MSQYYYLGASLPLLLPQGDEDLCFADFLEDCRCHLSPREWRILKACRLNPAVDDLDLHPLLTRWIRWETSLRNEIVLLRAHNLGLEQERWVRENNGPAGLFDIAREAVQQDNPLAAEKILDDARWSFLEELGVGHFFDFEALLVYSLKLQLRARQRLITREEGEGEYRRIYDLVVDQTRKGQAP